MLGEYQAMYKLSVLNRATQLLDNLSKNSGSQIEQHIWMRYLDVVEINIGGGIPVDNREYGIDRKGSEMGGMLTHNFGAQRSLCIQNQRFTIGKVDLQTRNEISKRTLWRIKNTRVLISLRISSDLTAATPKASDIVVG
jgi:hypothetical protein